MAGFPSFFLWLNNILLYVYTRVCIYVFIYVYVWVPLVAQIVKNLTAAQETWVRSLGWKIPERREWQPTPVLFPEFHGQRSLVG